MRDVTIIGAGPAGSLTAFLLARRGVAVTLVEQHRFPRDKVCGECLSALGMEVLGRVGLAEATRSAGAVELGRTVIHSPCGGSAAVNLPRPMWGLSRARLDVLLLDAARAVGAVVLQPARCESIEVEPRLSVRIRCLSTNQVDETSPTRLIIADGKSALPGRAPVPTGDFGIKTHFVGVSGPTDAIELFSTSGTYGGLAPIEGGRWNAAFSVAAERLKAHGGDVAALFDELIRSNRALARRLAGATRVSAWLAAPLPRFPVRSRWPRNVIFVGNAAAAIEPIGGEGMGLALRSAELAAAALAPDALAADALAPDALAADALAPDALAAEPCGDANFDPQTLRRAFATLWRSRRGGCRAAALAVSSSWLASIAADLLPADDRAARLAMTLMGKG